MFYSRIICQGDDLPSQGPAQEKLSRFVPETIPTLDLVLVKLPPQDTTKEVFISFPYISGLSKEFRRIFKVRKRFPSHLYKYILYRWVCPEETYNSSHMGESSRCLENRIKQHNTSTTSAICQYSSTHNHPKADISHFKIID